MKRILILTSAADPGRDVAARQLADEILRVAPREARVDVVDPSLHGMTWGERLRRPFRAGAIALRSALLDLLRGIRPDAVVVLHPAHAALLGELHRGRTRDYALIALVTTPGEIGWDRAPVDTYIVPGEAIAATLPNLEARRVRTLGYPVLGPAAGSRPDPRHEVRVLWIAEAGDRKGPKVLGRLLARPDWQLTLVTDDAELGTLARETALGRQLDIVADFKHVPALLARHHLVIARPETARWQEAIVAGCPLIAFRPSGMAEEANAALLEGVNAGGVGQKPREVTEWIDRAMRDEGRVLELWRRNSETLGRPHGGEAIARFLLDQAAVPLVPRLLTLEKAAPVPTDEPEIPRTPSKRRGEKKLLLCDLHTHTTWSDGKLTVAELVDFYGQRGFDALCITDHLCDPKRLLGKLVNLTGLVIPPEDVARYFAAIEREKKRAWSQYKLLLMSGIEFNKDGYTPKTSAHLLGVDLKKPIDPTLEIPALIGEIHAQGGLAIASHPHEVKSEWGKNTLYLWEHVDEFAPLLDAWEIANRDDLFNPVGLRKLPFIASSDFHKPKHIHSWKTLLWCEKDPEAIKQCIRLNRDVSLTLYRDHRFGLEEREETALSLARSAA